MVEAEHRQHAVVELTIRDLKDQALQHFPSGKFGANSAWTVIACLAHNLVRWSTSSSSHLPPTAASDTRPADAQRAPVDTSPSCPLALAEGDFTRALARMRALPATP